MNYNKNKNSNINIYILLLFGIIMISSNIFANNINQYIHNYKQRLTNSYSYKFYSIKITSDSRNKLSYAYFGSNIYSNIYSNSYTYSSNNLLINTQKPSLMLTPKPATNNYTISPIIKQDICENPCNKCVEPYKYSIGFLSAFIVLFFCYIIFSKLNYKNIIKKYIYNKHKKSKRRKNLNNILIHHHSLDLEKSELSDFGITNYNSDFS